MALPGARGRGEDAASLPDLFSKALIARYLDDPRFLPRTWLVDRVHRALNEQYTRFVLLTGMPGSGKTALMAHLARLHADAPRYFMRRDSRMLLQRSDALALLMSVGHQLAHSHPELFDPKYATAGASPFCRTSLQVSPHSEVPEGQPIGVSADQMTLEPRLLEVSNLQYSALLDPAAALADQDPTARIVVLIDALDEIRYSVRDEDILRGCLKT